MTNASALSIAEKFQTDGRVMSVESFGSGHINDTYAAAAPTRRYVLQRINTSVFRDPQALTENLVLVTDHMRRKIAEEGGDPERETLTPVRANDGGWLVRADDGGIWRMTVLIERSFSLDRATDPRDMREGGRGFGTFGRRLCDFPVDRLHETIPNFHNTPLRLNALREAAESDVAGRLKDSERELESFLSRADVYNRGYDEAMRALPLRVTHNDTKINNILFDSFSRRAIAVVDLDTVMPGLTAFDFGDAIRTGAATADEDTLDLESMGVSKELFSAYARGYLEGVGSMTPDERASLVFGAKLMTYECGARFLTDWLSGDTYFKTSRPTHNLDRARAQLKLLADIERRSDELDEAVELAAREF